MKKLILVFFLLSTFSTNSLASSVNPFHECDFNKQEVASYLKDNLEEFEKKRKAEGESLLKHEDKFKKDIDSINGIAYSTDKILLLGSQNASSNKGYYSKKADKILEEVDLAYADLKIRMVSTSSSLVKLIYSIEKDLEIKKDCRKSLFRFVKKELKDISRIHDHVTRRVGLLQKNAKALSEDAAWKMTKYILSSYTEEDTSAYTENKLSDDSLPGHFLERRQPPAYKKAGAIN